MGSHVAVVIVLIYELFQYCCHAFMILLTSSFETLFGVLEGRIEFIDIHGDYFVILIRLYNYINNLKALKSMDPFNQRSAFENTYRLEPRENER